MILINEALLIESEDDLVQVLSIIKEDLDKKEDSDKAYKCLEDYLWELWNNSLKLENHLSRALSEDIKPLVITRIGDTEDLSLLEFRAVSEKEGIEVSKRQQLIFDQLCKKYFKNTVSIIDRFSYAL